MRSSKRQLQPFQARQKRLNGYEMRFLKAYFVTVQHIKRKATEMKRSTRKFFLVLCAAGCLGFIWINSVMPGSASSRLSGYAEKILKMFFGDGFALSEAIIRKLAHCFEFAVFGVILSLLFYEKLSVRLPLVGFFGLGAAVCDETIQLFSNGRSSQIKDVWIDFFGFAAGTLLIFIFYALDKETKGNHRRL